MISQRYIILFYISKEIINFIFILAQIIEYLI
jgi:hypothetical protein